MALMPPVCIASVCSLLSYRVAEVVPSVAYRASEIHTTIGVCSESRGFAYEANTEQRRTLGILCGAVEQLLEQFQGGAPVLDFNEYLLTPEVLLVASVPDEAFVALVEGMVKTADECGLKLRPAWGAHTTISRFKASAPPEAVPGLLRCIAGFELPGQSIAAGIAVGYTLWRRSPECPTRAEEELQGQFIVFRRYRFLQRNEAQQQ